MFVVVSWRVWSDSQISCHTVIGPFNSEEEAYAYLRANEKSDREYEVCEVEPLT